jgi:hypothetical protein
MVAAIAALRGIAEREQKAFVGACQILQPQIAPGGKAQGFAREIADRRLRVGLRRRLDQAVASQDIGDARR